MFQALVFNCFTLFVNFQEKLTGTSLSLCACEAKLFGLLCDWRWVHILRQQWRCGVAWDVGGECATRERDMCAESAQWGSMRCGQRGHGGRAWDVGRADFPITVGVFLFSNYSARPFTLFLQKFTTERQNCRVVVWVRTSVAWCVVSWRGVPWCGVISCVNL
jgi:hypothetical protein